ncbi:MAG: DNA internalization-related competence protein ComEC/Rec2 [Thermodesulfobacteriota bacterium]|nr:DNA internalization-related competence protein ComEC/Rec2 [Thermodesulfobacteriota bacterium]
MNPFFHWGSEAKNPPTRYARPLIPALLALMCGISAGLLIPGLSGMPLALCGALLAAAFFAWKGRPLRLFPMVLFFLLGYWSLQGWVAPQLPPHHVTRFIDDDPWHIIGTLEGLPQQTPERTRLTLKVESLTRRELSYPVIGSIRVTVRGNGLRLRSGDRVACLAKLKKIQNFNNPGGFNYKRHLAFRGISASAYVANENLLVRLHQKEGGGIGRWLNRCREAVSSLIERASQEDQAEARSVLKALIIGDRSGISPENRRAFTRIGISHLLAISGLHVGMVATLSFFVFRYLLARSQQILMAAWARRGAAFMSVMPVLFYGFLAGMSPATQRAVIMVTVFLLALLFEREHDSINTLAVAAMVILIITPTALFEISFQLSFVAVFAILYALRTLPVVSRLRRAPPSPLKRLGLFVLVSAAAILGTLPFTLYYFNQTSLIGVLTNCLMVPLVGFLVVPMELLAALFLTVTPTLSLWIMKAAAFILQGGIFLAHHLSTWPFAAIKTVTPTWMEMALYYGLAWALLTPRKTRLAKAALAIIVLLALTDGAYWTARRFANEDLTVTYIDVGQGNAALLELPKGASMLIDGGGFYDNRFDVGARIVAPFLWQKKIATVETLVLSHPDPDHLNGLIFIARHFNVRQVWMTQDEVPSPTYKDFQDIVSEQQITVVGPKELTGPQTINGVTFQVLYPPPDFLERKKKDRWRSTNNNSIVLRVSYNESSFLFPGDIEAEAEQELITLAGEALKSDVLLVPHHGSKTSSTPAFLKYADPAIAVISAGRKEIFGLPCEKIVKRYASWGSQILRTDQAGAITITTDGKQLRVKPFLSDPVAP